MPQEQVGRGDVHVLLLFRHRRCRLRGRALTPDPVDERPLRDHAARFERHENRRGYVWVGGNYEWRGNAYVWNPGRYEAERHGYRWREPRWEVRDGVYVRTEGGWIVDGPGVAPPALREERWEARRGFVWIRGQWDWGGGQWNWVPGHYERERVGHHWRERRWENRDGVWVNVEGGWE